MVGERLPCASVAQWFSIRIKTRPEEEEDARDAISVVPEPLKTIPEEEENDELL